jgi:hypothetical protein
MLLMRVRDARHLDAPCKGLRYTNLQWHRLVLEMRVGVPYKIIGGGAGNDHATTPLVLLLHQQQGVDECCRLVPFDSPASKNTY